MMLGDWTYIGCCQLASRVYTNGPQGGNRTHGGRTRIELINEDGTVDWEISGISSDGTAFSLDCPKSLCIEMRGDDEMEAIKGLLHRISAALTGVEIPSDDELFPGITSNDPLLQNLLFRCQSPIEDRLCRAMYAMYDPSRVAIVPQWKDPALPYRVDFRIETEGSFVCVECDGHQWHEKTKEQVARGRARDRHFVAMGIPLLHFTGSEIFQDADGCCEEILLALVRIKARKREAMAG